MSFANTRGQNHVDEKRGREFQGARVSSDTEAMTALVTDSRRKTPARLASSAILACQSDAHLVKLVREGHERAFETIVARYRKPLLRFSARFLPESRTEDAVQQALINAHAALSASDEPVQLKPWLYTITRNAALNMVRQNGWNYEQIPLDFDGVRRPDQVVEQRIELQRTVSALGELPERQRDALVMREFEGRSYGEIALALGANEGAVRQLLNRARGTLRTAVSALTPPPLLARAAASLPPSDGRRVAEVFGSLGAAGIAKAGATAIVAGSLVVGAVQAPLPLVGSSKTTREKATLSADRSSRSGPTANAAAAAPGVAVATNAGAPHAGGHSDQAQRGHGNSGSQHGSSHRAFVFAPTRHSGSGDGSRTQSTSGEHRSGSGGDGRSGSGDTSGGGSHDSPSDGGSSTTSGSEDHTTSVLTTGSSGTSGSSGSSDGTSGSTSGGTDSTSGSSGSTDGSGTSGSGSSTTTTTTDSPSTSGTSTTTDH